MFINFIFLMASSRAHEGARDLCIRFFVPMWTQNDGKRKFSEKNEGNLTKKKTAFAAHAYQSKRLVT